MQRLFRGRGGLALGGTQVEESDAKLLLWIGMEFCVCAAGRGRER